MDNLKRSVKSDSENSFESPIKRPRIKEEIGTEHSLDHVITIINKEFQTEITNKQDEIKTIQNNLLQAHKTLHILKYAIIKSFYDKKELKVPNETIINNSGDNGVPSLLMPNQNRIHPAVKKIIGKQPICYEINRTRSKIQQLPIKQEVLESPVDSNDTIDNATEQTNEPCTQIQLDLSSNKDPIRNRQNTIHQIIVGNVSKWIPVTDSKNNATHKWMVYVRGPRDNPDINHIVKKVRFFLHPSYQPNDIVELEESPFHLSRRGWGEFPLRVQIHFHSAENKPVDIIHNLKLDRTYTGRQTLGNETFLNLWLTNNNIKEELISEMENALFEPGIKLESNSETSRSDLNIMEKEFEPDTFNFKNAELFPYNNIFEASCSKSSSEENCNNIPLDHISYCSSSTMQVKNCQNADLEKTNITLTELMADDNEQPNIIEETIVFDNNHIEQNLVMKQDGDRHYIIHNKKAFLISRPKKRKPESLLKRIFKKKMKASQALSAQVLVSSKEVTARDNDLVCLEDHCYSMPKAVEKEPFVIDREKYKIQIPFKILDYAERVVYFLLKSLPLYTQLANDVSYISCYPYVAGSIEEYSSWNFAKRTCSEWFRAKVIKNLLISHKIVNNEHWTVKIILMYGRAHAFTPLCSYDMFKSKTESGKTIPNRSETTEITSTFTEHTPISILMENIKCHRKYNKEDCIVDVETVTNTMQEVQENKNEDAKDVVIEANQIFPYAFVRKTAKTIGIQLKPEEISPNLWINSSECVLLKSIMCFAEEIIRKACANNIIADGGREMNKPIDRSDIMKVLLARPEFDIFLNTELGKTISPPS